MMGQDKLFSIRMRASLHGDHISGAERIAPEKRVEEIVTVLLSRARSKNIPPDQIVVNIDALGELPVRRLNSLDVLTVSCSDPGQGRHAAGILLKSIGISNDSVTTAIDLLSKGPASCGTSMRGAIVMDAQSSQRLEPDHERGIRASRFDWEEDSLEQIRTKLARAGLTHHRTWEALALATKIVHGPWVKAELCWSDDPDYTAGYVASLKTGYVRFPFLKKPGERMGGRVIFVDSEQFDRDFLVQYLQTEPVLIRSQGASKGSISVDSFIASLETIKERSDRHV